MESAWTLNKTSASYGTSDKGPYRYWFYADQSQTEVEVPNIKSISINRSLDKDAADCTIVIYNTWHESGTNTEQPDVLGAPGYLGFNYADSAEVRALYGQSVNSWSQVLVPNALLRTYQGYGGFESDGKTPKAITDAVADGELAITGTWLIDSVTTGTNGMMTLKCRDMAKLLIEQALYLPLIPERFYPLKYCRWVYEFVPGSPAIDPVPPPDPSPIPLTHYDSNVQRWYPSLQPSSLYHGHRVDAWIDGNEDTETWSVGVIHPSRIFARVWWEAEAHGAKINEVFIRSNYSSFGQTWISVLEDGVWQGAEVIPWDDANNDGKSDSLVATQFAPAEESDINFVSSVAVDDTGQWFRLPRTYNAQRIRVTTVENWYSPIGPFPYRAVVREVKARHIDETLTGTPGVPEVPDSTLQKDGNIKDWVDAVKDILLWSGFLYYEGATPADDADVHGLIETSGNYPAECLNEDFFDKKSPMEVITAIKEVLGYIFFIDEEGAVRFHSPNWWSSGNTLDTGIRTAYIPDLIDGENFTDYSSQYDDASMRSEITVGAMIPTETDDYTQFVRHVPQNVSLLRGMVKPAMLINEVYQDEVEQRLTAALIGLHIMFQLRKGQVTILANPEIQINDQVRITERNSSESYIHYVRSISSDFDADSGTWYMTLSTNWLGEESNWVYDRNFFLRTYFRDFLIRSFVKDSGGFDSGFEQLATSLDASIARVVTADPGGDGAGNA